MSSRSRSGHSGQGETTVQDGSRPIWHSLTGDEAIARLGSDLAQGLDYSEAARRLQRYGPNLLEATPGRSGLAILLAQFRSLIVILLLAAGGIALLLGDTFEAAAILVVILLNALIGYVTELRAEQAIRALEKQVVPTAQVIRGSRQVQVPSRELVPGDLVVLSAGDRVPADGRIVQSNRLQAQEASLTGESLPVAKTSEVLEADIQLADRANMGYLGTVVTDGHGILLVTETGAATEVGRIGKLLQEAVRQQTPLEKRLAQLSRTLIFVVAGLCLLILAAGYLRGFELLYMLEVAISLAIAAVPEGLPAVTTMTLALGVQRMARANALVRRLPAVESLGSTTVICTDKTGTLTRNEMTVTRLNLSGRAIEVTGTGYEATGTFRSERGALDPSGEPVLPQALRAGALCNDAQLLEEARRVRVLGDPTEGALLVAARKAGLDPSELRERFPRVAEVPFDSRLKRMVTVHRKPDGGLIAFTKGAPAEILTRSSLARTPRGLEPLGDAERKAALELNRALASAALRVLAVASRELPEEYGPLDLEGDFTFLGLVGMIDPLREEVPPALELCRQAGIRTVMITGDQAFTAAAIARQLGIDRDPDGRPLRTVHARELEGLDDEGWQDVTARSAVFARVSPEHKLRIVEALQRQDHVVAMTGDGVNDAPALRRADIGVAMGVKGTEVAKEAAAMILRDDNFATIVRAVEQGRIIYENILRFIQYLFSCNLSELLTVFVAIMVAWPLPLAPLQILWLNIITDVFPALALALEPSTPNVMRRPPRDPKASLLSRGFAGLIIWQGLLLTAVTLTAFAIGMARYGTAAGLQHTVTLSFMTLALAQVFHALNVRSRRRSLVQGLFSNVWLWWAIALCLALQLAAVYLPVLSRVLGTVALSLSDWGIVLGLSLLPLVAAELEKLARRRWPGRRVPRTGSREAP